MPFCSPHVALAFRNLPSSLTPSPLEMPNLLRCSDRTCDKAQPVLVVFLGTFSSSWCWIPVTGLCSCRCWGLPAAVTLFLPITIAPGQLPCELLEPSDIFQHISFSGREKCLAERAEGKGQAQQHICITSFYCYSWRVSPGLAGGFSMTSQEKEMDAEAPLAHLSIPIPLQNVLARHKSRQEAVVAEGPSQWQEH